MGPIDNLALYALRDNEIHNEEYLSFYGACLLHIKETHSQNFQDVFAWWVRNRSLKDKLLLNPQYPIYVEFGATNGVDGSNTLMLRSRYDWSGILAEPNPNCWNELDKNRSDVNTIIFKGAVYMDGVDSVEFHITDEPDLSTMDGFGISDEHVEKRKSFNSVNVPAKSLFNLLVESNYVGEIDYLSIDTEGSEFVILEAFFNTIGHLNYPINAISVEHNYTDERERIYKLLTEHGYRRVFEGISRWDDFYILQEAINV